MNKIVLAILALLASFSAAAQTFPQTLPPNTVYGRLGVSAGPGQAIPFATLSSQLFVNSSCLQINLTGAPPKGACERGPLFIWNNASGPTAAGQNMGCQFWVGANPVATPGAGDPVVCTMYIDNGNNRGLGSSLFGLNIVAAVADLGTGWSDTAISAVEVEVHNRFMANAPVDPFGGGATRKNGVGVVTAFGTHGRSTAAYYNWGAERDGSGWMDTAFASSSAFNYGWRCIADPGGTSDTARAFQTACLSDESDSTNILLATRTHTNGVNLAGATFTGNPFSSPGFAVDALGVVNSNNYLISLVPTLSRNSGTGALTINTNGGDIAMTPNSGIVAVTGAVSVSTKIRATGAAPALTSCGGGSPAITGSDLAGEVTMGTTATGCVITFNAAYASAPYCTVSWQATPLASQSYSVSNTAITTVQTSTSGNRLNYTCMARSGG